MTSPTPPWRTELDAAPTSRPVRRVYVTLSEDERAVITARDQSLASWVRQQLDEQGLEAVPGAAVQSMPPTPDLALEGGICLTTLVYADVDPLHVGLDDVDDVRIRTTARTHNLEAFVLVVVIALVAIAAALFLSAPRGAPGGPVGTGVSHREGLPEAPPLSPASDAGASTAGGDVPVPAGDPVVGIGSPLWAGTATWYCSASSTCTRGYGPGDFVAAIDTDLGIPKGATVEVRLAGRDGWPPIEVRIVDVCACAGERLIDLTSGAFARLVHGPGRMSAADRERALAAGVVAVTIEQLGASSTLPPTSTEESVR